MKNKTKLIVFILIIILLTISMIGYAFPKSISDSKLPPDISLSQTELETIQSPAKVNYLNMPLNLSNPLYISTGRFYIPFEETISKMDGKLSETETGYIVNLNNREYTFSKMTEEINPKTFIKVNNINYISLCKFLPKFGFVPVFNSKDNIIDIFYEKINDDLNKQNTNISENSKTAFIRLEDIMADGKDENAAYTDEGLEKLRIISDYLSERNQKFYIAWIPLYKNPAQNSENDLTKTFDTYNASFLYTLDYIIENGGKIGLHGFTHQWKDDKSSVGFEFGKDTPFSEQECVDRMLKAKEIARDLGFKQSFFEFPHYSATSNHMRYAEKYFDVIYQQCMTSKTNGYIEKITKSDGKVVTYIPTPADYLHSRYSLNELIDRMNSNKKDGLLLSLFFHPNIDFEFIGVQTLESGVRTWYYPEYAPLPTIVNETLKDNYTFKVLDY